MSMPPLLCAKGILKQIHKHFSFEFQCSVWRGHTHTNALKHINFDFATHHLLVNVHLKYKLLHLKSEMMVDNFILSSYQPINWEEDLKLDIIIVEILTDCFHLFSFWVLAQRPQQITQLLLDHCVSMSQFERAG